MPLFSRPNVDGILDLIFLSRKKDNCNKNRLHRLESPPFESLNRSLHTRLTNLIFRGNYKTNSIEKDPTFLLLLPRF
ncbi:hypothetical protein AAHA92_31766 [Salvia divinorum]|uniref:Uncharacterized protein n=1 Tax=Salvia divinorum TaxID=28513 RepID=A0ABD1FII3_SALDI